MARGDNRGGQGSGRGGRGGAGRARGQNFGKKRGGGNFRGRGRGRGGGLGYQDTDVMDFVLQRWDGMSLSLLLRFQMTGDRHNRNGECERITVVR